MNVLLDTHAFLWAAADPSRLSAKVRSFVEGDHGALLSVASLWEICVKVRAGKLGIPNPAQWLNQAVADLRLTVLPIRPIHALGTLALPDHHRDPFDRMIITQAIDMKASVATVDDRIKQYAVDIFW